MGLARAVLRKSVPGTCLWATFERGGRALGRVPAPAGRLRWGPSPGVEFPHPALDLTAAEELFRAGWRGPRLLVREGMTGELRAGGSRVSLQDLEALGLLRGRGGSRGVDVTPAMEGRIEYRGYTITFEHGDAPVTEAPAEVERPRFAPAPAEFRRTLFTREDRPFVVLIWGIYAVLFVASAYLATRPLPKEALNPANVSKRFARLLYEAPQAKTRVRQEIMKKLEATKGTAQAKAKEEEAKAEPEKPKPKAEERVAEPAAKPEPSPGEGAGTGAGDGPGAGLEVNRTDEIRKSVAGKGLLGLLGGRGSANVARPGGAILQGGGSAADLDQVLKNVDGLQRATEGGGSGGAGGGWGGGRGVARGIDDAARQVAAASARAPQLQERKDKVVESKEAETAPDALSLAEARAAINKAVASYVGGLRYLYNKELRKNPDLEGKLTVALTVAPSGAVTDCRIVDSTLNAPELEKAILDRIRKWTLPSVASKPITVTYPFVFFPTM